MSSESYHVFGFAQSAGGIGIHWFTVCDCLSAPIIDNCKIFVYVQIYVRVCVSVHACTEGCCVFEKKKVEW